MGKEKVPLNEGDKYGYLTVVKLDHIDCETKQNGQKKYHYMYSCSCICGSTCIIDKEYIKYKRVLSCGCYRKSKKFRKELSEKRKEHGLSSTRLYLTWQNMKNRCENDNLRSYKNYGGRGIKVCEEWKNNFQAFYGWAMNSGYRDDLTIERIDVNGNYEPSNCCWIPLREQSQNKRNSLQVTYLNETHCLSTWAKILDIPYPTLLKRFKNANFNLGEAIKVPVKHNKRHKIHYNGQIHSIREWEKLLQFRKNTISYRLHRGWSIKEALDTPPKRNNKTP